MRYLVILCFIIGTILIWRFVKSQEHVMPIMSRHYHFTASLPAGTTVQIRIDAPSTFFIGDKAVKTYTHNYIIPRNLREIGYNLDAVITTQETHISISGCIR